MLPSLVVLKKVALRDICGFVYCCKPFIVPIIRNTCVLIMANIHYLIISANVYLVHQTFNANA